MDLRAALPSPSTFPRTFFFMGTSAQARPHSPAALQRDLELRLWMTFPARHLLSLISTRGGFGSTILISIVSKTESSTDLDWKTFSMIPRLQSSSNGPSGLETLKLPEPQRYFS